MNRILIILLTFLCLNSFATFDSTFYNKSLRIDYIHAGTHDAESFYLDEVKIEPFWGGSKINLVDTFQYGVYYLKVFDALTDSLIYSRGYGSLFGEWQTTAEAKIISRAFTETLLMPLPQKDAKIIIYSRDNKGVFTEKFTYSYKSDNYFIHSEVAMSSPSFNVIKSGDPATHVDIVILPEGYTEEEMGIFIHDCEIFADILFSFEPYATYKDKFNIRGILAPSKESGSDIPADTIWNKTIMNSSFYTFDSERYCMTYDNKSVRNLAANAPYDQIYVLVNSTKYGGGAIYNYYSMSVNSNLQAAKIFVHEFGHGFAGLGDEYYNSEVAYSEFYPVDIEPWEPNLTTLVNFDDKWKNLITKDIPVPTPSTAENYEMIGVYEGGGYVGKGVYRPKQDCLMNTFRGDHFCKVCQQAIEKMILFYSE